MKIIIAKLGAILPVTIVADTAMQVGVCAWTAGGDQLICTR
jgi:hypothetical protein